MKKRLLRIAIVVLPVLALLAATFSQPRIKTNELPGAWDYQISGSVILRLHAVLKTIRDERVGALVQSSPNLDAEYWSQIPSTIASDLENMGVYDRNTRRVLDQWGNQIVAISVNGDLCILVSPGPNHVFEFGGGDDLMVNENNAQDKAGADFNRLWAESEKWGPDWFEANRIKAERMKNAEVFVAGSVASMILVWIASKVK